MPRRDRTYTDKDVIRIFMNNLDRKEQTEVMCWFIDTLPILFGVNKPLPTGLTRNIIEGIVGLLPFGGTVSKVVSVIEALAPTLESRCALFRDKGIIVRPR